MVFSSMVFLWKFLPMLLFFYYISKDKFKNSILLIASLIFYAWGEPKYVLLMLFSILINYILGILLSKYPKFKKIFLLLAIFFNLGLLGYFKYFNFFSHLVNKILAFEVIPLKNIVLPIGISFYTFQILSYIIDLYRGQIAVQKNIFQLALYVSLFPQLVAGPIVQYKDVEAQIKERHVTVASFAEGIRRFVYGLSKKVIFANSLALVTDTILSYKVSSLNTYLVWIVVVAYTLQIYYDFSGYSDMAIGLGKMFGFHFLENFNLPYLSNSITEFWRRWHISLSSWFKNYLYIPLGGNRKGKVRTYINLFVVFLATGLWHGAGLNFIIWGIYYGIFLILEKMFLKKVLDRNRFKWINHFYVMLIVMVGWVFFRANGIRHALDLLRLMFSFQFEETAIVLPLIISLKTLIFLIFSFLFCGILQSLFKNVILKYKGIYQKWLEGVVLIFLMVVCIFELVSGTYNPFIYFRF